MEHFSSFTISPADSADCASATWFVSLKPATADSRRRNKKRPSRSAPGGRSSDRFPADGRVRSAEYRRDEETTTLRAGKIAPSGTASLTYRRLYVHRERFVRSQQAVAAEYLFALFGRLNGATLIILALQPLLALFRRFSGGAGVHYDYHRRAFHWDFFDDRFIALCHSSSIEQGRRPVQVIDDVNSHAVRCRVMLGRKRKPEGRITVHVVAADAGKLGLRNHSAQFFIGR